MREVSKESLKKQVQTQLNNSSQKHKFTPKNSYKPPTKYQQYNPSLHQGAKLKNSHSALGVANKNNGSSM